MSTHSLTQINSAIYKASTVTFLTDTDASTTVDIDQTKITKLSSDWCPQTNTFTVNTVTQAATILNVKANTVSKFEITPFSASVNCGTLTNTWTYKGIDLSDGQELDPSVDLISVHPSQGSIQIQSAKPAGIYKIKVLGTLPDLMTTYFATFTIIKLNPIIKISQ